MPIVSLSKRRGIASALLAGAIILALSVLAGCGDGSALKAAPTADAPTAPPSTAVAAMATATAAPSRTATATAKATATAARSSTATTTATATAAPPAAATATATATTASLAASKATVVPAAGSDGAIVWTAGMQCSGCHPAEVASMTDSRLIVNAHAKAGLDQCTACHDLGDLQKGHEGANTIGSPVAKYSNDFCLKCHGTYADLAKRTASSTALQTPEGKFINPHLPPTATHASDVACWNCHEFHGLQTPLDYCYTCHMKQVLECNTCHGSGGVKD